MMNENETLDCIAIKREAQARIYEEIKGMTHQEEIEYFRNAISTSRFREWWNNVELLSKAKYENDLVAD
ncbi:MAG: hypothetical protein HYZ34_01170 [Ignavibacteriae bacterium]|nr:hypothetical protein [Ignavibacteriota bacterium]